ncbi:MAG: aspartate/methionine/tyrosine aminotransferase [Candidatus Promineifilaceae bacterium]|jgi:aspartate/methionine/tyrosine aminotransferase
MRNFELEKYFAKWEFSCRYHMTASDLESWSIKELLAMEGQGAQQAFEEMWLGYTEVRGGPEVLAAIAQTYETMSAENILCFCGANEGIYATMRGLLSKGDHVIAVVPNYQSSETIPLEICQVTGVVLHEDNDWRLDLDEVKAAIRPNTKMFIMNFPNNPTGAVMPKEDLDSLIQLCREHDLYLFSDEVFRLMELDEADRMPQIADIYEKGISLNVMSKAYGLPGLRVGWIASQDLDVLQRVEDYKHYLSMCNSAPSEHLTVVALRHREQILHRNRELVRSNLAELDMFLAEHSDLFSWTRPKGSCIGFVKYLGDEGVESFCKTLVEDHGILVLPASLYNSDLVRFETQNFRIGFGRNLFQDGMAALREALA